MAINHLKFHHRDNIEVMRVVSIDENDTFHIDDRKFFGPKVIFVHEDFFSETTYTLFSANESDWQTELIELMKSPEWVMIL